MSGAVSFKIFDLNPFSKVILLTEIISVFLSLNSNIVPLMEYISKNKAIILMKYSAHYLEAMLLFFGKS